MPEHNYVHDKLEDATAQIRLLRIDEPVNNSAHDGRVSVSLSTWYRSAAPEYVAISYLWGPENPQYTIFCRHESLRATPLVSSDTDAGQRSLQVRHNCFALLRQLQKNRSSFYFWMDALSIKCVCITSLRFEYALRLTVVLHLCSQDDLAEKAEQVQMIGTTFRSATRVCAFVDQQGSDLGRTMPSGRKVVAVMKSDDLARQISMLDVWVAITSLKYWDRLWVVQEIVMAGCVELWFGDTSHDFDSFVSALEPVCTMRLTPETPCEIVSRVHKLSTSSTANIVRERSRWQSGQKQRDTICSPMQARQRLEQALYAQCEQRCSDPRDRIFGMISMLPVEHLPDLKPDYTLSPLELAKRVLRYRDCFHYADLFPFLIATLTALDLTVHTPEIATIIAQRQLVERQVNSTDAPAAETQMTEDMRSRHASDSVIYSQGVSIQTIHAPESPFASYQLAVCGEAPDSSTSIKSTYRPVFKVPLAAKEGDIIHPLSSGSALVTRPLPNQDNDSLFQFVGRATMTNEEWVAAQRLGRELPIRRTWKFTFDEEDLIVHGCFARIRQDDGETPEHILSVTTSVTKAWLSSFAVQISRTGG